MKFAIVLLFYISSFSLIAQSFEPDSATGTYSFFNAKKQKIFDRCFYAFKPTASGNFWVKDTTGSYRAREFKVPAYDFYEGREFGQWGLISPKGKWIIPPTWNSLDTFINGKSVVGINRYEYLWVTMQNSEDWKVVDSFVGIEKDGRYRKARRLQVDPLYGLINDKGKVLITPQYKFLGIEIMGLRLAEKEIDMRSSLPGILVAPKYILIDEKNKIFQTLTGDEITPFYNLRSIDLKMKNEISEYDFVYKKLPNFYRSAQVGNDQKMYYGLLNAYGQEILSSRFIQCELQNTIVYDEIGEARDTLILNCDAPFFYYDSTLNQMFFLYKNERENQSLIASCEGNILYEKGKHSRLESIDLFNQQLQFVADNGLRKIELQFPFSASYDTVEKIIEKALKHPDKNIVLAWASNIDLTDTGKTIQSVPFYWVHGDSLFGFLNNEMEMIVPEVLASWNVYNDDFFENKLPQVPLIMTVPREHQVIISGSKKYDSSNEIYVFSSSGKEIVHLTGYKLNAWNANRKTYSFEDEKGVVKEMGIDGKWK